MFTPGKICTEADLIFTRKRVTVWVSHLRKRSNLQFWIFYSGPNNKKVELPNNRKQANVRQSLCPLFTRLCSSATPIGILNEVMGEGRGWARVVGDIFDVFQFHFGKTGNQPDDLEYIKCFRSAGANKWAIKRDFATWILKRRRFEKCFAVQSFSHFLWILNAKFEPGKTENLTEMLWPEKHFEPPGKRNRPWKWLFQEKP